MNEILSRALNFSQNENKPPSNDQEAFYQEKYIVALEEKLKITLERDTMARILEEKNFQLESLIKYSAELERKLGISEEIINQQKLVAWVDVVRKYFSSFNEDPEDYEKAVESFINDRKLSFNPVKSDSSPGKLYYGIPSSLHVEFAAYFSELWQKGLTFKDTLTSGESVAVEEQVDPQIRVQNRISPRKRTKIIREDSDEESMTGSVVSMINFDSVISSGNVSKRSSARLRSFLTENVSSSEKSSPVIKKKSSPVKEADIELKVVENSTNSTSILISSSPLGKVSMDMELEECGSRVSQEEQEESNFRIGSVRPPSRLYEKVDKSSKNDVDTLPGDTVGLEKTQGSPSRIFVPITVASPRRDGMIKEHKFRGITMYIWLDILNAYFPEAVKTMKGDNELYKNAKSAVKMFLTENYPSIGISYKEMEHQKLLYIPKTFEVTFKSWFKEEFNSGFQCLKSCSKNPEPDQPLENDLSIINDNPGGENILLKEGSCIPPKKPKSNHVRYNLILKDIFPEFHAQTKSSRGRIRNSVKGYLSEKVDCLEDCRLLQKDRHGAIKVSYGIPREFLEDFQKWAVVRLRFEYGEMVPLADWEH